MFNFKSCIHLPLSRRQDKTLKKHILQVLLKHGDLKFDFFVPLLLLVALVVFFLYVFHLMVYFEFLCIREKKIESSPLHQTLFLATVG